MISEHKYITNSLNQSNKYQNKQDMMEIENYDKISTKYEQTNHLC